MAGSSTFSMREKCYATPFVIGELSLGHLRRRVEILALLASLPSATLARHKEVLSFVESRQLAG